MGKKRVHFIFNPAAGRRKNRHIEATIRENLDPDQFEHTLLRSSRNLTISQLTARSVADGADIIVGIGGDGTINEILQGIGDAKILTAIVPVGSGNGLARHLAIPQEPSEAIRLINGMNSRWIDTGSIGQYRFVSITGFGLDARVASHYRKARKRGFGSYLRIVMEEFFTAREGNFDILADGKHFRRSAMMVNVANSNQFGYNTIIAPSASLTDGMLDLVITRKFPLTEIPRLMHLVYSNKIDQSAFIETFKVKDVTVTRDRGKRVNVDGEAIKMGKEVRITVRPSSLNIIVPAGEKA